MNITIEATADVSPGNSRPSIMEFRRALTKLAHHVPPTARITVEHRPNDSFRTEVRARWSVWA